MTAFERDLRLTLKAATLGYSAAPDATEADRKAINNIKERAQHLVELEPHGGCIGALRQLVHEFPGLKDHKIGVDEQAFVERFLDLIREKDAKRLESTSPKL